MIDLYFIKTLDINFLNETLKSFYVTVDCNIEKFNIYIVNELETREKTLNHILQKRKKSNDLFVVADDILFTEGWYDSLCNNLNFGDIVGFTMIKPKKNIIHNNGFDFVKIDKRLTYLPYLSGASINCKLSAYRECDGIVGCAMYIKSDVLDKVKEFPNDGYNRWGELLFSTLAKKENFKTIVLGHKLFHYSISSKQKEDIQLSSMSWLVEDKLWQKVVEKYLNNLEDIPSYNNKVSTKLKSYFNANQNILIYGCGTVADIILKNVDIYNVDIVSGLKEEIGIKFHNLIVQDINKIALDSYDFIVISAIGYEDEIIDKYFSGNKNILKLLKIKNNSVIEIGVK